MSQMNGPISITLSFEYTIRLLTCPYHSHMVLSKMPGNAGSAGPVSLWPFTTDTDKAPWIAENGGSSRQRCVVPGGDEYELNTGAALPGDLMFTQEWMDETVWRRNNQ